MRVTSIGEALSERENKRKSNNQQIWNILCRMHRMLANIYYCFEISLCEICRDSATDRTQKINRAQRRHIVVSLCAFCHLLGSLVNKWYTFWILNPFPNARPPSAKRIQRNKIKLGEKSERQRLELDPAILQLDSFACSLTLFHLFVFWLNFLHFFSSLHPVCNGFSSCCTVCLTSDLKICKLYAHRLRFIQYRFSLFKMQKALRSNSKNACDTEKKVLYQWNNNGRRE